MWRKPILGKKHCTLIPLNIPHWRKISATLGQRSRRLTNINPPFSSVSWWLDGALRFDIAADGRGAGAVAKAACFPVNTRHWSNVGWMLGQRRRRWSNINPTLVQCLVFTGLERRRSWVLTPLWPSSFKATKCFFPTHSWRFNIVGRLRDREVACSPSDRQGLNFESCVFRVVSSHSAHHHQKVLLAQFSLHVH